MRDLYNRWWVTTGKWDKVFALLFVLVAVHEIVTLMISPSSENASDAIVWSAFAYASIGFDYYRALWYKFEPLTDFGAAIGEHLHTYGDLLLEKNGGRYTATPLTRHD